MSPFVSRVARKDERRPSFEEDVNSPPCLDVSDHTRRKKKMKEEDVRRVKVGRTVPELHDAAGAEAQAGHHVLEAVRLVHVGMNALPRRVVVDDHLVRFVRHQT